MTLVNMKTTVVEVNVAAALAGTLAWSGGTCAGQGEESSKEREGRGAFRSRDGGSGTGRRPDSRHDDDDDSPRLMTCGEPAEKAKIWHVDARTLLCSIKFWCWVDDA